MQLDIMLFFQNIRTPLIQAIANVASMFGEIAIPLLIIMVLLWCCSRKKAFAIITSLLSGLIVSQILKAIFRIPRPFQAYPELIEGDRIETATGYSFPSGHSTTSGAFYSSIIVVAWKKWATALCIIPIIAVPLSRLVLGVHWPLDVTVGSLIGLAAGCILTPLMLRLYDTKHAFLVFTFTYGIIASLTAAVLAVMLSVTDIDPVAFEDLMSNAAITGSAMLGFYLERKTVRSTSEEGSIGMKILRFVSGVISTAVIAVVIFLTPAPKAFTSFAIYFMLGLWCIYIYPLIAVKIGMMEKEG